MSADWYLLRLPIVLLGDFLVFFGSLAIGLTIRNSGIYDHTVFLEHVYAFLVLFVLYEIALYIAGLWDRRFVPTSRKTMDLLVPTHILATVGMVLVFYFLPFGDLAPKTNLFLFSVILFVLMFGWKIISGRLLLMAPVRAILVGNDEGIKDLLESQPLWNISIERELGIGTSSDEIQKIMEKLGVDTVLVCVDRYPRIDVLYKLIYSNVHIIDTTIIKEEVTEKVDLEKVDELWFIQNIKGGKRHVFTATKRVLDILISLPIFIVFLISIPLVWFAMHIEDRGQLFSVQRRIGRFGKTFDLFKYRTMTHANQTRWRNKGDEENKVTRVGAFLRKSRLDELPQCLNILAGQISFVGPRAILESEYNELQKENPYYRMRLLVQPGLTGWAQIMQPYAPQTIEEGQERLAFDFYYIKNMSLWLEIKTILKTVNKLSQRMGMRD